MKTNRHYLFILNGERKEIYAPSFINAWVSIIKAYPEVKKLDYRKLNITEKI